MTSTAPMTTTWADIETTLTDLFGASRRWRNGTSRAWWVPMPTTGRLTVKVTLRPRWCSLAIDRWHTTDRDPEIAHPWLAEHVWPAVDSALQARSKRGGYGVLPSGQTFASAHPIDRAALLAVLIPWVEQELTWTTDPTALERR
jgi:hypothetical protein